MARVKVLTPEAGVSAGASLAVGDWTGRDGRLVRRLLGGRTAVRRLGVERFTFDRIAIDGKSYQFPRFTSNFGRKHRQDKQLSESLQNSPAATTRVARPIGTLALLIAIIA